MAIEVNCGVICQPEKDKIVNTSGKNIIDIASGSYDANSLGEGMPVIDNTATTFETKIINGKVCRVSNKLSEPVPVSEDIIKEKQKEQANNMDNDR